MTKSEVDDLVIILKTKISNINTTLSNESIAKLVVANQTIELAIKEVRAYANGDWHTEVLQALREQDQRR